MKDFLEEKVLPFLIPLLFLGGCGYLIFRNNHEKKPLKNEQYCSFITYYDTSRHFIVKRYTPSTYYKDNLINFDLPNGIVYSKKDFAIDEIKTDSDNLDYDDITLKNGTHFTVTQISNGGCQINAIEDSIQYDLRNPPSDDDNNN